MIQQGHHVSFIKSKYEKTGHGINVERKMKWKDSGIKKVQKKSVELY